MNPSDQFSIKGKVAVVLGGTSGIGQAIARGYAAAGALTIASSRDKAKVDAMADEIEKLGSKTLRITSDVQDRGSLEILCNEVVLAFGQVDILVVTSGTLKKMATADLPDWHEAHRRMATEGRRSKVRHPSEAHRDFRIPPPRF